MESGVEVVMESGVESGGVEGRSAAAGEVLYGLISEAVRRIPRDMSLTSLATLATLDRTGPRRITDLAMVEGVAQPSMTTLVSVLERAGFAERRRDPADGRVALIEITAAGSQFLASRRRAGAEAFTELIRKLPSGETAALIAAIPALEHLRALGHEKRDLLPRPAGGEVEAARGEGAEEARAGKGAGEGAEQ
jgi:DNA-binding MarR family transcriptional regulator